MYTAPDRCVTSKLAAIRPWLLAAPCALPLLLALPWLAKMAGLALPAWLGAAGALIAVFAMLVIAWRAGALRGGFMLALAAALLLLPVGRHLQWI